MIKPPEKCSRCGKSDFVLRGQINSNGVKMFAFFCLRCNRWANGGAEWLNQAELKARLAKQGNSLDDVPIYRDYSARTPCIICGAPGEWHHWAPQSTRDDFAPDWFKWPGAYLCREHHMLWHHIVTPELVR